VKSDDGSSVGKEKREKRKEKECGNVRYKMMKDRGEKRLRGRG